MVAAVPADFKAKLMEKQEKEGKDRAKLWFDYRRALRQALEPDEYVVLEVLEDAASERNDGWCWVGYEGIARASRVTSRANIAAALKTLRELGVVETEEKRGCATRYRPLTRETLTSSNIERVNQYVKRTTTRSKNELPPVQKMNPNGTK